MLRTRHTRVSLNHRRSPGLPAQPDHRARTDRPGSGSRHRETRPPRRRRGSAPGTPVPMTYACRARQFARGREKGLPATCPADAAPIASLGALPLPAAPHAPWDMRPKSSPVASGTAHTTGVLLGRPPRLAHAAPEHPRGDRTRTRHGTFERRCTLTTSANSHREAPKWIRRFSVPTPGTRTLTRLGTTIAQNYEN